MRTFLERRELAEAELVQDLSRLGVAERVVGRRLEEREGRQRRLRELGHVGQRLVARDQAVPAEERHEPRESRRGDGLSLAEDGGIEPESSQVDEAAPVRLLERAPGGHEVGRAREPLLQAGGALGLRLRLAVAVARTIDRLRVARHSRDDVQACAPAAVRLDLEAERHAVLVELGLAGVRADPGLANIALPRVAQDDAASLDVP